MTAAIAIGVRVPADKVRVFGPVYSRWRLVCRTFEAVLLLTERGFILEAAPMIRNILNHAYAFNWLVDNGNAALVALVARGDEERERLCRKLEATGWPNAAEFHAAIDQAVAQQSPPPVRTSAEQALRDKLKHETSACPRQMAGWTAHTPLALRLSGAHLGCAAAAH
ncbi:hypothetical protein [Streptomyces sp. NPDC093094]|uniref:hypothetical protein n=1 Tax=Streptomyces sp. NPDC093094 TaxID=3366026 RepID=UPI0038154327